MPSISSSISTSQDAVKFLTNAGRALRVGGHIRLSTPGLEWVMRSHYRFEPGVPDQVIDTLRTNRAFHGWGHQFLYSRGMLEWLFTNLNYDDVRFRDYGQSEIPIFAGYRDAWQIPGDGQLPLGLDRRGDPGQAGHRNQSRDDGADPEGIPQAGPGRALIRLAKAAPGPSAAVR